MKSLTLLRLSDAFEGVWGEMASECGLELAELASPELLGRHEGLILVAAGGEEELLVATLRALQDSPAEVVAVGALPSHRLAVSVLRAGAAEYFALPQDYDALRDWLRQRAGDEQSRERRAGFAEDQRERYAFRGILGTSSTLRRALATAERVIPHTNVTVLLTGETGTGKELVARAIHYEGPRREGPFVDINCAAIPEQLLESELFGHERGAFTGATSAKPGLFEVANGGTIFLDEIGHLALSLQGKLLRALEERTIRRVGGQRPIKVNVRVVAATHVDLAGSVRRGEFRADLYHRLNVVPLELPPLRDRREDILPLARHYLVRLAREYRLPTPMLSPQAERVLLDYGWPGNVRELRNAMERVLLLADGERIDDADLAFLAPPPRDDRSHDGGVLPFPGPLNALVRAAAAEMIALCQGNKSEAARRLGISRPRLARLTSLDPASFDDHGDSDD
jgi:DNA-binding NtrC family response regulator